MKEVKNSLVSVTKFDSALMDSAFIWANLSSCVRRQVGCVIAKDSRILATGYNGTISGTDNCCEYLWCTTCSMDYDQCSCAEDCGQTVSKTKDNVLHAEQNALMFALKHGISTRGATVYCTDAPCVMCAKLLTQAGIVKVFYNRKYRSTEGIDLLNSVGIKTQQLLKD